MASRIERFVKRIINTAHKFAELVTTNTDTLNLTKNLQIDIKNYRGQSYENASNME